MLLLSLKKAFASFKNKCFDCVLCTVHITIWNVIASVLLSSFLHFCGLCLYVFRTLNHPKGLVFSYILQHCFFYDRLISIWEIKFYSVMLQSNFLLPLLVLHTSTCTWCKPWLTGTADIAPHCHVPASIFPNWSFSYEWPKASTSSPAWSRLLEEKGKIGSF